MSMASAVMKLVFAALDVSVNSGHSYYKNDSFPTLIYVKIHVMFTKCVPATDVNKRSRDG